MSKRIYLSPPHMSGQELFYVHEAFESNWLAPLGPQADAFESEFASVVGVGHALAVASGTGALHLALICAGVGQGDEVLVSTLTFAGSVFPITYVGARPVFIDSELVSWNMDPALLEEELMRRARKGRLPKALILVHLYGQCADTQAIREACDQYGVILIEDAAEALGARYRGTSPGGFGQSAIFSFNGNKILTTSGGGMLVSNDESLIAHARKLSSQAREPTIHYEHETIGYNYRMSNVLAAIGRGQLQVLEQRVEARRRICDFYVNALGRLPGIEFMPEAPWSYHSRWLTVLTVDPDLFGADREQIRLALEAENIESRPVWKPMHLQPVFTAEQAIGGKRAQSLFERGLCLPSGSNLTSADLDRVVDAVLSVHSSARRH
jgi:dTDP-4-amino-4,6-dideoxygalactose transaminase